MSVYDILKKWEISDYKTLTRQDIDDITLGASILATGGGGDPEIGLLWAYNVLNKGKEIVLIKPEDVPDDAMIAMGGCLGAPVVLTEKTPNGSELNIAFQKLSKYLNRDFVGVIPPEAGGVNTTVPMAVAGEMGLPVIDGDGMGRAFPELQMTSFHIGGVSASPVASINEKGFATIIDTTDAYMAENIVRQTAMSYGGISWIAGYPMNGEQLRATCIPNTVSLTLELGKKVREARNVHHDPIKVVEEITGGWSAFKGKIVDINRDFGAESIKGFSMGQIIMEGFGEHKGSTAVIDFQNEWLKLTIDNQLICLPPDLITILDSETAEPIRTDIVKYGYRGTIVVVPAHERMKTEKAIEVCGPRAFGYDLDFVALKR
ncbi:DUF917 domain-containing protein [Bacillus sp. AFS031507]|uniref:DUF917 domain-containing protein n=1 Tax=Bacillus sp. AFS031507 TaxID=2033496 RepID=UPI000BFD5E7B|nr:DUF917 domain-containing protein [Bacillus sp. AFS031507]PGY10312.1 hypothetical protein COE25_15330 [Bacillus sp. AFS031507]